MFKSTIKKSASIMMVALLVISMFCVGFGASAAETSPTESASKTVEYNIDKEKTASLTLYKYEVADVDLATHAGTGEQDDAKYIPEGAKPLANVTFGVYKIAELDEYFTPAGVKLPKAEEVDVDKAIKKFTTVTNKEGVAKLTNLPLGIYYVDEINGPAQITKKIEPFVTSLPMTTTNGDKWIYDVYSYPKNQTGYGDASLQKVDSTTGEALANAEFTLDSYGVDNKALVETIGTNLVTGENGIFTVASLPSQTYYRFTETKSSDESYILDGTVSYEFYIDPTGDMIAGWTSIDEHNQPVEGKVVENNTLVVKNEKPDIHKYILDGPKGLEGIDNTASYGDTVYWKIRSTVPSESLTKKMKTYTITDTMSEGIKYDSAEIYLDDQTLLKEHTDYTIEIIDALNVRFNFVPEKIAGANEVIIYYNTILTENAPLAVDIPNTSKLTYTNVIGSDSTFDKQSEIPTVHTGGYYFLKTDGSKPLGGAKFELYTTEEDAKGHKNALRSAVSSSDGVVEFKGLAYGSFSADEEGKNANGVENGTREYWIAEVEAPEGYIAVSGAIKVEVNKKSHLAGTNENIVNTIPPKYPQTGGFGLELIIFGICGLVACGITMLVVFRNKKKH